MNEQIKAAEELLEQAAELLNYMSSIHAHNWNTKYRKYQELFIKKEVERGIKITKVDDFGTPFDEPQNG